MALTGLCALGLLAGCAKGTTLMPADDAAVMRMDHDAGDPKPPMPDGASPRSLRDASLPRDADTRDAIIEPGREAGAPDAAVPDASEDASTAPDASEPDAASLPDADVAEDATVGEECGGLDYLGECDGDVARWCSSTNNTIIEIDCAESGETCQWIDDETGYFCRSAD